MWRLWPAQEVKNIFFVAGIFFFKGCLNGGGQIKSTENEKGREMLKNLEKIYSDVKNVFAGTEMFSVQKIYQEVDPKKFHTNYHAREKIDLNPLLINW
jgi:iron only hydrogenase large subunit-like protein